MFKDKMVLAVVAAGGSGARFNAGLPKQFLPLLDKTVIAWSAGLIQRSPYTDYAVMSVRREYIPLWNEIAGRHSLSKFTETVPGGSDRQSSVYAGVRRAAEIADGKASIIIIHDAARPLATQESLDKAIEAAEKYGGAVVSVPARDTIKMAKGLFISETPERTALYIAQTPQVFRLELLLKAHEAALKDGFTGSDDASLVERIGGDVCLTPGTYGNIKITHPEDLALAETLARFAQ
ncbi:MAG: 2-C-methyl-D-erythritol 4-phosphate cytidylyltransferase [Defluviitaleaceae bacterium]|nr:2-C-methyl-D-erythritol 4-phosphate cytidylyltransferase [Defluviitaleaceae bacterium]MCL2836430.1 2-C-methyl-D-erythritol 4-phosphate cytidylyltransferase [Defluviitaleaceae bacterium]